MSARTGSILPPLDPEQTLQCAAVTQAVRVAIARAGGWLSFDDYLRVALYEPGLGYYSAGSVKFGRDGDFVTAPETSTLFARALARQCAEVLQRVGGDVLELGAGSGALAAALLPALQQLGSLPESYYILEVSADLAERQRERLAGLPADLRQRIRWLDALPASFSGVGLANEVADALPFQRFSVGTDGLLERGVALDAEGGLRLADQPAGRDLQQELQRIAAALPDPTWPVGYESELCTLLGPWVNSLGGSLARGALLLIDYGLPRREYYHPQRSGGTLRCHFRHRAHEDALLHPGLQDITAWVDFTRVAEAALDAQLAVAGYCTQAAFLLANDIGSEVAAAGNDLERAHFASEARQLLLPDEMGEHFKVMALTRQWEGPLRSFAYQDQRHLL